MRSPSIRWISFFTPSSTEESCASARSPSFSACTRLRSATASIMCERGVRISWLKLAVVERTQQHAIVPQAFDEDEEPDYQNHHSFPPQRSSDLRGPTAEGEPRACPPGPLRE